MVDFRADTKASLASLSLDPLCVYVCVHVHMFEKMVYIKLYLADHWYKKLLYFCWHIAANTCCKRISTTFMNICYILAKPKKCALTNRAKRNKKVIKWHFKIDYLHCFTSAFAFSLRYSINYIENVLLSFLLKAHRYLFTGIICSNW